jgi:hypothetical protein
MPPTPEKAPVATIVLHGAEVPGAPRAVAHSWEEAQTILTRWGDTAPAQYGYHKTDFHITFANGIDYRGRFDLERGGREHDVADLQRHVREFCAFHSGRWQPAHITLAVHQALLDRLDPETRAFYATVLDTCDLGPLPASREPHAAVPSTL